jgi:hypothetical protein
MRTARFLVVESSGNMQSAVSFPARAHYYDNQFSGQAFQDTALTTPSGDGEVVGSWFDRVGSAPLTQATNKPINRLTDGVEFDGTNDTLAATITTIPATGFTLYYRIYPDDFDAVQVAIDWGDMTIASLTTSGLVRVSQSSVGTVATSVAALNVTANNAVGIRYNPTSGAFRICINNNAATTGTLARAVSGTSLNVATENGSSFPFDGKMLSIAIYSALHDNATMDAAMTYWNGLNA